MNSLWQHTITVISDDNRGRLLLYTAQETHAEGLADFVHENFGYGIRFNIHSAEVKTGKQDLSFLPFAILLP